MNTLSTHALDTTLGRPAAGLPLRLEFQEAGEWKELASAVTNSDGRVAQLLPKDMKLSQGIYRMTFDTHAYFQLHGQVGFYPYVSIVFELKGVGEHYHIPLLLSPYGYSTYRGS